MHDQAFHSTSDWRFLVTRAGLKLSPWDQLGPAGLVAPALVPLAAGVTTGLERRRDLGGTAGGPAAALSYCR